MPLHHTLFQLWLSSECRLLQAPLYTDKASLFAKSVFVVGYDTAIRLVMPKYYGGHTQMLLQLSALHHQGCKFLVAGRLGEDGAFLTLDSIDVPEELADKVGAADNSKTAAARLLMLGAITPAPV